MLSSSSRVEKVFLSNEEIACSMDTDARFRFRPTFDVKSHNFCGETIESGTESPDEVRIAITLLSIADSGCFLSSSWEANPIPRDILLLGVRAICPPKNCCLKMPVMY